MMTGGTPISGNHQMIVWFWWFPLWFWWFFQHFPSGFIWFWWLSHNFPTMTMDFWAFLSLSPLSKWYLGIFILTSSPIWSEPRGIVDAQANYTADDDKTHILGWCADSHDGWKRGSNLLAGHFCWNKLWHPVSWKITLLTHTAISLANLLDTHGWRQSNLHRQRGVKPPLCTSFK